MKRFQFALESILELRQWEERQKEIDLGKIIGECVTVRRQIEERTMQERQSFLDRRDGFDLEELLEIEHFGRRMRCERQELSIRLEDLEAKRAEAQEEFLEASRKRKVLEKLKERKAEIHRKQELAVQQRSLDEIGSSLSVRVRQGR
ncbi:flagellar export protein FliJ [Sediminispirochaeta smaragdinae]|jgi:flagellar FliJ protein|uniref:Flagellar FliJ protein n=1 Tax=Sediminispirochaeta smaragdinae (strain DSM 11293 / JCM 15392 / SEBR 4228) TaxID=573413 RepID=E1R5S8_SEDSS|nr:flagellar export protein FliJ [Sediminispirochaeta smaragdinae]ADK80693.1 flagellar export protein FliJ [Sediminispirochaeta smaragdinae DSM 11293]